MTNEAGRALEGAAIVSSVIPGVGTAIAGLSGLAASFVSDPEELSANPFAGPGIGGGMHDEPGTVQAPMASALWGWPLSQAVAQDWLARWTVNLPGATGLALGDQAQHAKGLAALDQILVDLEDGPVGQVQALYHELVVEGSSRVLWWNGSYKRPDSFIAGRWEVRHVVPRAIGKTFHQREIAKADQVQAVAARVFSRLGEPPQEPTFIDVDLRGFRHWMRTMWHRIGRPTIGWGEGAGKLGDGRGVWIGKSGPWPSFKAWWAKGRAAWRNKWESHLADELEEHEARLELWIEHRHALELERQRQAVAQQAAQAAAAAFDAVMAAGNGPPPPPAGPSGPPTPAAETPGQPTVALEDQGVYTPPIPVAAAAAPAMARVGEVSSTDRGLVAAGILALLAVL